MDNDRANHSPQNKLIKMRMHWFVGNSAGKYCNMADPVAVRASSGDAAWSRNCNRLALH